uniref:N-acetylated alpha-linked acidic dipeptidase like 2 n=1 Tax=Monodelphis domestica TaxID=13616 RepID=A0A5F8G6Y4_MONDO
MAYQKVNADQRAPGHSQYLDNDDLQATALDLEWDMEQELEEPGFDRFQLEAAENQNLGNSDAANLDLDSIQPATSPKGRFQRLQEDSDYMSRYPRTMPKNSYCNIFRFSKIFCTLTLLFILGIVIGYYAHTKCPSQDPPPGRSDPQLYQEILKEIKAEEIQKLFRYLIQLSKHEDDTKFLEKLKVQWTSYGLEEVQLFNYSVLFSLPGSSPNTVTLKNSSQCFYPNGQPCDQEPRKDLSQGLLYSYAAYSARGTLEAEVIDVRYGTAEDVSRIRVMKNVTNRIALLKLGKLPLLYKLSLLERAGFGGVLLYVDPCDLPKTSNLSHSSFMVSLNPGGDPSTPGYPSIVGSSREDRSDLTRLLVQPISASLVATLLALPEEKDQPPACRALQLPSQEIRIVTMKVQTVTEYKTLTNVVGYLKGASFPDRYVIVGSHHHSPYGYNGQEWASGTAIITAFIQALMLKVKRGWRPDRTIIFSSWGGTTFGNIGSYEWAEDFKKVLQRNVVAYVSLHNPIRGNSSLHPVASPSLQQLVAEGPSFLSEALFPVRAAEIEELDPFFNLHETITKLSGEVILQIANDPVLPFNALDIALEVQNSLKGDQPHMVQLLEMASRLRDSAELFQSDEMRPANDPKERAPIRVRMLNDILQDLEKNFLVQQVPPGFYRNILYRLDEKTHQFSILHEVWEHDKLHLSNETLQAALSKSASDSVPEL